jgi:hypothetical protein
MPKRLFTIETWNLIQSAMPFKLDSDVTQKTNFARQELTATFGYAVHDAKSAALNHNQWTGQRETGNKLHRSTFYADGAGSKPFSLRPADVCPMTLYFLGAFNLGRRAKDSWESGHWLDRSRIFRERRL